VKPKAIPRSTRISDSEILAMYEAIMPLLYDNPKGLRLTNQINKQLIKFVWYDFLHFMMEDSSPNRSHVKFEAQLQTWGRLSAGSESPELNVLPALSSDINARFNEHVEQSYLQAVQLAAVKYPTDGPYHYHRIVSRKYPRIAVGFFRMAPNNKATRFTPQDLRLFQHLRPHILRLFRVALNQTYQSQAFQYFDSFASIGSRLALEHKLSDTEVKLLPDILFGYTNEEIAARHFVSLATVKSHIKHILKKTGTKNRIDFISKFFTSPEHVQL
jgi:DNA-binding CsgD family transcriptional regulator